ncbi:ribonuclease D [Bombella saccharophila]|uniref:Ribonuclease D n=1 Tax=Bombella saccharophila TaxID=2967338 RepID=A0ABT3W727_9PROT|nr:ribonuclease D [Bombella saccharophila]MCX5614889.1 ribonuclease D [Bombella saccharophila]
MSKKRAFPAPTMITTSAEVATLCAKLQREAFVTVDTEFVRESTYWPRLCLVQLGGADDVALIDACVPGIDLSPLAALLAAPDCVKVFHAARQDLEIFLHLFGELPVNLFDTQIAAMVAGFGEQVGYDNLVSSLTGQSIDKSHRFSDWAARPLSKAQIAYASADVTHLRVIYETLLHQLEEQGRRAWVEDELSALGEVEFFRPDPYLLWKKLKPRTHNRKMLAILRDVVAWREEAAQQEDRPRQRIIRDESLLEIAATRPRDTMALKRIRGVTKEFAEGPLGHALLAAVQRGEQCPEEDWPEAPSRRKADVPRPPAGVLALLKVLLTARSEEGRVAPRLIASAEELERLAHGESDLPVLKGWRARLFGREAQALLRGETVLCVEKGQLRIVERDSHPPMNMGQKG